MKKLLLMMNSKKQIYDFGLIKKGKIENINYKTIYETFAKYENDLGI